MTPGTLFFDTRFIFKDGEEAKKIIVVLGSGQGVTIAVKSTSQGRRYRNDYGCQADHRFPNFHLVQGCCCLAKPTWVCLDEYYEFRDSELVHRHFSGEINRIGVLTDPITIELLECALATEDINGRQVTIVQAALDAFRGCSNEDYKTRR